MYRQILDFLHTAGPIRAVGVEGTGSYGAELARTLTAAGVTVIEVMRINRQYHRLKGKSDPLDAEQATLTVAAGQVTVVPKQRDGRAESLRILLAERISATKVRTAVLNQIHALLITAPGAVRANYRRRHGSQLVAVLARTRPGAGHDPEQIARASLKTLGAPPPEFGRGDHRGGPPARADRGRAQSCSAGCPRRRTRGSGNSAGHRR
ncbi:UNVERIFIED_CONTAM: transposase [Kocuria sp. CPCC 205300]